MGIFRFLVTLALFFFINCENISTTNETLSKELEKSVDNVMLPQESIVEYNDDMVTLAPVTEQPAEAENELPILPPIILLNFDEDNSTLSEEKFKRTIDNNLGYGYLRNNLLNGKFNYYFPGGKTGTTVSIEESVSPFEPKTIIDRIKPIAEKSIFNTPTAIHQMNRHQQATPPSSDLVASYPIFGQRTKLQKYSPPNSYVQRTSSTPKPNEFTTPVTNHRNMQSQYTTLRPSSQNVFKNYATPQPNYQYQTFTSVPSTYESKYNILENQRERPGHDTATVGKPLSTDPSTFNLPKYTVENGVRYENKIIWKYQDGRIADAPPTSYTNLYSEYANSNPQNMAVNSMSYQDSHHQHVPYSRESLNLHSDIRFNNANRNSYQPVNGPYHTSEIGPNTPKVRHPPTRVINSNVHNQRPSQFPTDESSRYQSINSNKHDGGLSSQSENYDFSYQQKYGLQQRDPSRLAPVYKPVSNYAVDSSNPEPTSSNIAESSFTSDGQLTSKTLSKYSLDAQQYLTKIFNQNNRQITKQQQSDSQLDQYKNGNYENLLNYNPSISEYIRDPSSILNAQPTFIQAGNSLIPVIILRVGGTPPQHKSTSSINLKALLQQYLSQYAQSKAALSVPSTYEYKETISQTSTPIDQSAVQDLTKFTHALSRFSQNQNIKYTSPFRGEKLRDHPLEHNSNPLYYGKSSYETVENTADQKHADQLRAQYGSRIGGKPKVKSVQIIGTS